MQSGLAAQPPPPQRASDDGPALSKAAWLQLCTVFMVFGVATCLATYCFQIATELNRPPLQNTSGHILLLRDPYAAPMIRSIDGNPIGTGLSTKISPISMVTPMEVFARLRRVRLKIKKRGDPTVYVVWLPLKKVFLETEGDKMVLYVADDYTVVTVHRDMWVQLTLNGTTEHNFTATYMREMHSDLSHVPEIDGETYCQQAGCAEGCPNNQFLTRVPGQGEALSCVPCMTGSSSDPKGLFPGLCFCDDKSLQWVYNPPTMTHMPPPHTVIDKEFPLQYVETVIMQYCTAGTSGKKTTEKKALSSSKSKKSKKTTKS